MKYQTKQTEVTHILELTSLEMHTLMLCLAVNLNAREQDFLGKEKADCLRNMHDEIRRYLS